MGTTAIYLAPLPTSHPSPSALAISRARDWVGSPLGLPNSFGQSAVVTLSWLAASSVVGAYRAECYGVFLWSRAISSESPAAGWNVTSPTAWGQTSIKRRLKRENCNLQLSQSSHHNRATRPERRQHNLCRHLSCNGHLRPKRVQPRPQSLPVQC